MRNQLIIGALAALSLGLYSCSSEDAPNINNGATEGDRYMAVRIQTAGLNGTRAGEGFEEGTAAEGELTATNTRFFFFDASGNAFSMEAAGNVNGTVASNMVTPTSITPGNTDGNATAGTAVLVLGKGTGEGYEGVVPARAICISGLTDAQFTTLQNQSLATVANNLNNYSESAFVLSNSNWDGALTNGAVDVLSHIAATPDAANANPVDIYMDRLAVKVRMNDTKGLKQYDVYNAEEGKNDQLLTLTIYKADGTKDENVSVKMDITNFQLQNTTSNAYLIKALPDGTGLWTGWNDADYHRCYWAAVSGSTTATENTSFDIYADANWQTAAQYTNEWVGGTAASQVDRTATCTGIALRGYVQYQVDGNWTNLDLIRWAGTYYYGNEFKQMVANDYNATNSANITTDNVTFVADGVNTYKVQINNADYKYTNIMHWVNGVTSFYVNLAQNSVTEGEATTTWYGVVRNHIYDVEINKVLGLGYPGNGPENPEDNETFVSARLNVLNWKVVSNGVTLQ